MFVLQDGNIFAECDAFSFEAGSSIDNYFLKGLAYKLSVKPLETVRAVNLYSSGTKGDKSHKFAFVLTGGVYEYQGVAGSDATAIELAKEGDTFEHGIGFYFTIEVVGENLSKTIERRFWVKDPSDIVVFETEKLDYVSPYPVLVGNRTVPFDIAPNAKNAAGVRKYGGAVTAEVFTAATAPSSGSHVTTVPETVVASLSAITLTDRTSLGKIPDFIVPPGFPDFSNFYHYVTVRLRAKAESTTYRDINAILFASRKCKNATYGYDSSGEVLPAPVLETFELVPPVLPPTFPPPVCSSKTYLETSDEFNIYASQTKVAVYDQASGGTLLASGIAVVEDQQTLYITRTALGGTVSQPVAGFFEVQEFGPDRTSGNRYETYVNGCSVTPVTTVTVEYGQITVTGRSLEPTAVYRINLYAEKYGNGEPDIFDCTYMNATTLAFNPVTIQDGYWEILENGIVINSIREYSEIGLPDTITCMTNGEPVELSKVSENNYSGTIGPAIIAFSAGAEYVVTVTWPSVPAQGVWKSSVLYATYTWFSGYPLIAAFHQPIVILEPD